MGMIKDLRRLMASAHLRRRRRCVVCGSYVGRFLSYRRGSASVPRLSLALAMVGSDVDNFECPRCGCHDRERHLALYFEAYGLWQRMSGMRVLHFAPERHLSRLVAERAPIEHQMCDLHPQVEGVQIVDLEHMPFADKHFDLLIANHVLEHVSNDRRALGEIVRVLRPGGLAILQTPYSSLLENTWEDPGIRTPMARLEAYGQEDHVRLYGLDIFTRFASTGLKPRVTYHADCLADINPLQWGVNSVEPFFLFEKLP